MCKAETPLVTKVIIEDQEDIPDVEVVLKVTIPKDKMVKRKTTFLLLWSPSDLSQGNSAWPVAMRLLNSTSGRSGLPCRLGGQLLPGKQGQIGLERSAS